MDFTMIASGVITALIPYLKKGGEKLVDKAVDEGFAQRGKIWEMTKGLFLEDNLTLLNLFEENPDDAKTQGKLESKLEDKLQAKPEIAREFESILKQIPGEMKTNSVNITGDNNKVAQDIKDSTITIS